jgi:hypothetical protein
MEIVEKVTDKNTQMKVAQPGDPTPPVPKHCKGSWAMVHFGKRYALDVLLEIEPENFALCILHMNLCFVGKMVQNTMLSSFTGNADDEKRAEALHLFLADNGVALKPPKATADNSETFLDSIQKHSFAGADAAMLLQIWEKALEICWPGEMKGQGSRSDKARVNSYCGYGATGAPSYGQLSMTFRCPRTRRLTKLRNWDANFQLCGLMPAETASNSTCICSSATYQNKSATCRSTRTTYKLSRLNT